MCQMLGPQITLAQPVDGRKLSLALISRRENTPWTELWWDLQGEKARSESIENWPFGFRQFFQHGGLSPSGNDCPVMVGKAKPGF